MRVIKLRVKFNRHSQILKQPDNGIGSGSGEKCRLKTPSPSAAPFLHSDELENI